MVFTLESGEGQVLGRRCMEVRICSCPLRDLRQEEAKLERVKSASNLVVVTSLLTGKKGSAPGLAQAIAPATPEKTEASRSKGSEGSYREGDEEVYWVPVRGRENYQAVERFAEYLDLVAEGLGEAGEELRRRRSLLAKSHNPHLQTKAGVKRKRLDNGIVQGTMPTLKTVLPKVTVKPGPTRPLPPLMLVSSKVEEEDEVDGVQELLNKVSGNTGEL